MFDEYQKITREITKRFCLLAAIFWFSEVSNVDCGSKGGWICRGSSHLSCNGEGISLVDLRGGKDKKGKKLISNLYRIVASKYAGSLQMMEKTENRENFCSLVVRHVSN